MTDTTVPSGEAEAAHDAAALDRLVRFGGAKLLAAMLGTFRTNGRERLADGRAAVAAGDAAAAKLAYHSLKSSAAQLGAVSLARLCADAEARSGAGHLDLVAASLPAIDHAYDEALAWMEARAAAPGITP